MGMGGWVVETVGRMMQFRRARASQTDHSQARAERASERISKSGGLGAARDKNRAAQRKEKRLEETGPSGLF
jgi:hypothetical protein